VGDGDRRKGRDLVSRATCGQILREIVDGRDVWRACGARARSAIAHPPAGTERPDAKAAYCDAHGGHERAVTEVARDWMVVAPASVGGYSQVLEAGCMSLVSTDAIVVVRYEAPSTQLARRAVSISTADGVRLPRLPHGADRTLLDGCRRPVGWAPARAQWVAPTGVDVGRVVAALTAAGVPHQVTDEPAVDRAGRWLAYLGVGSMLVAVAGSHATAAVATSAARAAWGRRVSATVEAIRAARGGTLDWGMPVAPRGESIVATARAGECSWDAYARVHRA
jgi:hypothetical protein